MAMRAIIARAGGGACVQAANGGQQAYATDAAALRLSAIQAAFADRVFPAHECLGRQALAPGVFDERAQDAATVAGGRAARRSTSKTKPPMRSAVAVAQSRPARTGSSLTKTPLRLSQVEHLPGPSAQTKRQWRRLTSGSGRRTSACCAGRRPRRAGSAP